ncbi:MAG TPA: FtsX-like permease family protein [Pseudomonadales bacterium]|nr:FtsX-like permease family protein [Pseudomonadales bacterium]
MPLLLLSRLGWRNLWRYRRRNLMLFTAIMVAVAGCVLISALIRGYQHDMMDDAIENLTGNLKVMAPGYRADPSIARGFRVPPAFAPDVPPAELVGWAERVRVPAVVISERETRGVTLIGIDPAEERAISFLGNVRVRGDALSGPDDGRILLGRELARQLDTDVGRRIVVMTQGADGRNREAGFRVAGLYDAAGTAIEKAYAFTGIRPFQELLGTDAVTEISVRLRNDKFSPFADAVLRKDLNGLEVLDWRTLEPQAAAMFQLADAAILIWFIVLLLALAFGLVNTLITAVLERVREFGMLRALGMRRGAIVAQVVIESVLIVLAGLAVGIAVGLALVAYFSDGIDLSRWAAGIELAGLRNKLVPHLLWGDVAAVGSLAVALGLFASAYPAWRAVRIEPLDALRR